MEEVRDRDWKAVKYSPAMILWGMVVGDIRTFDTFLYPPSLRGLISACDTNMYTNFH